MPLSEAKPTPRPGRCCGWWQPSHVRGETHTKVGLWTEVLGDCERALGEA
jgi:hypothetical protein